MARTTDQIMRELDAFFEPSREVIRQQQKQIRPQVQAQLSALDVQRENQFRDITSQAQSRRLTFSGLPIQEQARYIGERFLPARAGVRQAGVDARTGLAQRLADIELQRGTLAQQIRQGELDREASARAAASQTSGISSILGSLFGGGDVQGAVDQPEITDAERLKAAKKEASFYGQNLQKQIEDTATRARIFNSLVNRYQSGSLDADDRVIIGERINDLARRFSFRNPLDPNSVPLGQPQPAFVDNPTFRLTRSEAARRAGI